MVVCVFLRCCAARDSPLTNTVRQRLDDISSAERWTSRDHDLSKTSGRRPALTNLELVRPRPCGVLSSLVLVSMCPSQMDDEVIE